jgi:hypothetical protein
LVDDGSKKRETSGGEGIKNKLKKKTEEEVSRDKTERFQARDFNKEVDPLRVESLTIKSDRTTLPLDSTCRLDAELKMNDGSTIPATRLVDWKVVGSPKVNIDSEGKLTPKEEGVVEVSATYMGTFSNDVTIKIVTPVKPVKKKGWLYYFLITLLWLLLLALSSLLFWIFIKSRRLCELAVKNPREFIKEVYLALCRGFKFYGVPRFNYVAFREFFDSAKTLMASRPEPMHLMTEEVLEARFSEHKISVENSRKTLGLFHEVKGIILEREGRKEIWKKSLFLIFLLEVLLVPKDIK